MLYHLPARAPSLCSSCVAASLSRSSEVAPFAIVGNAQLAYRYAYAFLFFVGSLLLLSLVGGNVATVCGHLATMSMNLQCTESSNITPRLEVWASLLFDRDVVFRPVSRAGDYRGLHEDALCWEIAGGCWVLAGYPQKRPPPPSRPLPYAGSRALSPMPYVYIRADSRFHLSRILPIS